MCSARRLMVFNVCVKFHENMSSGFKVMEQTRKLLTDTHTHTHTEKRRKHYTPMAYFVCGGYKNARIVIIHVYVRFIALTFARPLVRSLNSQCESLMLTLKEPNKNCSR